MNKQPLITICITTYNRKEMLKKTLESSVNQTYKNIEIIIGDNHSDDGTEELCKEYAQKDSRIQYYRHEKNLGMTENANFVFEKASGEYFIALSDDDWLDLDYIEQLLVEAVKHPDYSMILSSIWFYNLDYSLDKKYKPTYLAYDSPEKRIEKYIKKNYSNAILEGLWKTDILKNLYKTEGGFQHCRMCEDWTLTIKFLAAGKCKMVDTTHYNKMNAGFSTNGNETTHNLWPTEDLKGKDPVTAIGLILGNNVVNDGFFKLYLSEKERIKIRKKVVKAFFITSAKTPIRWTSLLVFMCKKPLFLIRKDFYKKFFPFIYGTFFLDKEMREGI